MKASSDRAETVVSGTQETSILAVHPGALGDVVLFGRLLETLGSRVTLAAGGEKARLLAGLGVVAGAMDFDSLPMHEVFADVDVSQCALPGRLGRHGRLISCFGEAGTPAGRRLAEMCGAAEAFFLPTRPPADFPGHLLELWARQLGLPADVTGSLRSPSAWPVPEAWRGRAGETLAELGVGLGRPYAAIHPGAGAEEKCWPVERFCAVAAALAAGGLGVVFVPGPVELDRWRDGRLERLHRAGRVLAGAELSVLAGVLAAAAVYVGNDSGASHLAAAVGAPTVALFGPTDPRHFRPLGPSVRVVAAGAGGGSARMADITVEQVLSFLPPAVTGG